MARAGGDPESQEQGSSRSPGCELSTTVMEVVALLLMVTAIALGILRASQLASNDKPASLMMGSRKDHAAVRPDSEEAGFATNSTATSQMPLNCTCPKSNYLLMLEKLREHLCSDPEAISACELCPSGWLLTRGRCFFFSHVLRSWEFSREQCRLLKSDLLSIEDEAEMDLLDRKRDEADFLWTAYLYDGDQRNWFWPNGSVVQGNKARMQSSLKQENGCGAYRAREVHHVSCRKLNQWICVKTAFQFNV
ncbi:killer cell lectin-like receptor subfamily G member 1 [Ambystoma mexicanum]|uniref:killer cell lectin-like receptor subfamily G member 1 n=1 Tax=Ambystoma mexicanum TaxID=8296 RepID=UPI0037E84104